MLNLNQFVLSAFVPGAAYIRLTAGELAQLQSFAASHESDYGSGLFTGDFFDGGDGYWYAPIDKIDMDEENAIIEGGFGDHFMIYVKSNSWVQM